MVIIAQLAHALAGHIDGPGAAGFAFLFVIVWWAWLNGTLYHELHGNDDIRTRFFTFLQMFTVAAMAVFAHDAMGKTSVGFALSYAAFQLILTYLWWRTGVHDPDHRPLSRPYSVAFLATTSLFVTSVFVTTPMRFYLWGIALFVSLLLPLVTLAVSRRNPEVRAELDRTTRSTPSIVERFGLFTIIVLGEVVVGVVGGVAAHHHLTWLVGATAGLGMLIAIGLWWIYFDFVSHRLPKIGNASLSGWLYSHLPMTMGIAAVGAAVVNVVEHSGEPLYPGVRWLLVAAVSVVLASVGLLIWTIQVAEEHQGIYRPASRIIFVSSIIILLTGLTNLSTIPLLAVVVVLLLAPVFYGLKLWLEMIETKGNQTISN